MTDHISPDSHSVSPPPLQYGSVCSGIEAVSLAWKPLGFQPAWFAEIDPFACSLLAYRYPNVPNLGDMTQVADRIRAGTVCAPDILVGGTPCQSFSIAGQRRGLSDPRGALSLTYVEIADAIDDIRIQTRHPPAILVWENVPGMLTDRSNAFGTFLGALAGEVRPLEPPGQKWTYAGVVSGPRRRIAWRVLNAQHFGVAQRRRRVFLVASGRDDIDPAAILFERSSVRGDSAPGGAPFNRCTESTSRVVQAFGGRTTRARDVGMCLLAAGSRNDFDSETFVVQPLFGTLSHTLAFAQNTRGEVRLESGDGQLAGALSTGGGKPGQGQPMIISVTLRGREHGVQAETGGEVSPALRAHEGSGSKAHVLTPSGMAPNEADTENTERWCWRVRRLMPVECERLQGLPDGYTQIPYRGKSAADTPRYKVIGNAMAVPCIAWLGKRLLASWPDTRPLP